MCPNCEIPVLDDIEKLTSYCDSCATVWMSDKLSNPLADYVDVDEELIVDFDKISNRVG